MTDLTGRMACTHEGRSTGASDLSSLTADETSACCEADLWFQVRAEKASQASQLKRANQLPDFERDRQAGLELRKYPIQKEQVEVWQGSVSHRQFAQ